MAATIIPWEYEFGTSLAGQLDFGGVAVVAPPDSPVRVIPFPSVREQFAALAEKWRDETSDISSLTQTFLNQAYQDIIGLGPAAIPLLLEEVRDRPDLWFHALRSIVHQDLVDPADSGNVQKMAAAWLKWGRDNKLVS